MKVGIIGSGDVGQALAAGFESRGHEVKIGSRDPKKGSPFAEVAKWGDLLVVATLWSGTKSALDLAGPASFRGKVVMDVTNPLEFEEGKGARLALGHTDSGGEQVQRWLPGAKVVKAFNTVGYAHMVDPRFEEGRPDMFIAGDDPDAKKTVTQITESFGWGVIDAGGIEASRLLEPLCILWVDYGVKTGTWNHAFKLLRK
jgi:8-hydroxy-5-deazaflavin:NADPH oxidoreductase